MEGLANIIGILWVVSGILGVIVLASKQGGLSGHQLWGAMLGPIMLLIALGTNNDPQANATAMQVTPKSTVGNDVTKLTELENVLVESFYSHFQKRTGCSVAEAKQQVISLLVKIREEAHAANTANQPAEYGDRLLAAEKTDSNLKQCLDLLRSDGVTDTDICKWWNKPDTLRRLIVKLDEVDRLALFVDKRRSGMSAEDTGVFVRKCCVVYGDPVEDSVLKGDDKPIPFEMMDRVQDHFARRNRIENAVFMEEVNQSNSMNAYIRSQLRAGRL